MIVPVQLAINEITGIRFQGEGPYTGEPVIIVRLAGCNLGCGWCDSAFTWDWKRFVRSDETRLMSVDQVADQCYQMGHGRVHHLMITGGEPMLQQAALHRLAEQLGAGWFYEIETAGTIAPQPSHDFADHYNVSLKLEHSGNARSLAIVPDAINALNLTRRAAWKFVAQSVGDFSEIDRLVEEYILSPVYVMPEGIDAETILSRSVAIAEAAIARGYSFSTRLHVLLYGSARGY